MRALPWITEHWFELLQTAGIIGGLLFTAITVRKEERARKITNSIAINEQHRQIWTEVYAYPELSRVMMPDRDLEHEPVSDRETLFVNTLIVHLSTAYRAMKYDEFVRLEGLSKDVKMFFSLAVPRATWQNVRAFHDNDFVDFIEALLE
ncbi:MAG: DUF6082 family protein [Verrucomicrobia bacterium]|nr:DUF6082 family protein [Verrucomicrobiota bacterium]